MSQMAPLAPPFGVKCSRCGSLGFACMCASPPRVPAYPIGEPPRVPCAPLGPPPTVMEARMTGDHFVIWLRGYIAAGGTGTVGDWKTLAAKLDTLGGPK